MCCGLRRDQLFSPSVVMDVSLGKSNDHSHELKPTSHHEFGEIVVSLVAKGIVAQLNEGQFGQVYPSFPFHTITLEHDVMTMLEGVVSKHKGLQLREVYSSLLLASTHSSAPGRRN